MEESKSVQKSVRLTPSAYKVIEGYRGEGFNEKLANLVLDYDRRRDELKADWDRLTAVINDRKAELKAIQSRVRILRELEPRLAAAQRSFLDLLEGKC